MTFDPRSINTALVVDTCAVWNVLSARKLYFAARAAHVRFAITAMVFYECVGKPRLQTAQGKSLQDRLHQARTRGDFRTVNCVAERLLELSRTAPIGLSSGELSCLAIATSPEGLTLMTDERQARHHARERLNIPVETTPRLYGWLHFHRHLTDGDHPDIVNEHESLERRPITRFLNEAYESAMAYRLMNP